MNKIFIKELLTALAAVIIVDSFVLLFSLGSVLEGRTQVAPLLVFLILLNIFVVFISIASMRSKKTSDEIDNKFDEYQESVRNKYGNGAFLLLLIISFTEAFFSKIILGQHREQSL